MPSNHDNSTKNFHFFYEKRLLLNVEENQPVLFLETFYEVKLERSHPNLLCILFIGNKGH